MNTQAALVALKEADKYTPVQQQEYIEGLSRGLGIEQFRKGVEKARQGEREANTVYGSHLIQHALNKVTEEIIKITEVKKVSGNTGGARRYGVAVKYLRKVKPEVAAYFALKAILDGITQQRRIQKVAIDIARYIEDEVRFNTYAEQEEKSFKYSKEIVKKATSYSHKRNAMSARMAKVGLTFEPWPTVDRLHIGMKLIDIVVSNTNYAQVGTLDSALNKKGKPDTTKFLYATPEVAKWIEEKAARCELLSPCYLPCVIPPKEWTGAYGGGYHTRQLRPLTFVKTGHKTYLEEINNRTQEMSKVYAAVNALQNTPWKINTKVLDVMKTVWDEQIETSALVPRMDISHVKCPKCSSLVALSRRNARSLNLKHGCFEVDAEAHRAWKIEAARAHESNARLISKRIQTQKVIWTADLMKSFEKIYMPYQLDFRGRIYAVPNYLNPQGADPAKGLLTFGEGKPLGTQEAANWLAIHGANVYGNDKVSFAERISFIEQMTPTIQAIVQDPINHLKEWADTDKPFQFLAFCFEWVGYKAEGLSYVSHLPIALDGTCSGIQHFSAMLRDEVGARAVNLISADKPADIYQTVCDKVVEKLKSDLAIGASSTAFMRGWLDFKLDRKLTKRQVMTLPYGSTKYSCREYTAEHLQAMIEQKRYEVSGWEEPWEERERFKAVTRMSEFIWDSIEDTVTGARLAMDWLQDYAKLVAKEDVPITWVTPVGFPVLQAYYESKAQRVDTVLDGKAIQLTVEVDKLTLAKKQMAQGVSPNFVHSMDASHLILSVAYGLDKGITDYAMIHDSYGTHAANTELLSKTLRHAFVDMYEQHDVITNFKNEMCRILSEKNFKKIPPDLARGTLNLTEVLNSQFFFA